MPSAVVNKLISYLIKTGLLTIVCFNPIGDFGQQLWDTNYIATREGKTLWAL